MIKFVNVCRTKLQLLLASSPQRLVNAPHAAPRKAIDAVKSFVWILVVCGIVMIPAFCVVWLMQLIWVSWVEPVAIRLLVDFANSEPWQWFVTQIWDKASAPEQAIIAGIAVIIALQIVSLMVQASSKTN